VLCGLDGYQEMKGTGVNDAIRGVEWTGIRR